MEFWKWTIYNKEDLKSESEISCIDKILLKS